MTKEELEQLTDNFSDSEIAQIKNITRGAVGNWRKKLGVKSYTAKTGCLKKNGTSVKTTRPYSSGRPYKTDGYVTFFDEIDTPAKAYFLGFIASDGNLDQVGRTIRIQIHNQDRHILETFLVESGWKTKVIDVFPTSFKRDPQVVLCLSSVHTHRSLASWGITPAKSLDLQLLKPIPSDLQSDFVRGVWDGDGYITNLQFGLTSGSKLFIEQINEMIHQNVHLRLRFQERSENHYVLTGSKDKSAAIQWIYKNQYPALDRKVMQFSRYWSN